MGKLWRAFAPVGLRIFVGSIAITGCASTTGPVSKVSSDDSSAPNSGEPGCTQENYSEPLPAKASLSGLTFSEAAIDDFLLGALELRYPIGKAIVEGGLASPVAETQGNCIDRYVEDKSSASSVLRDADAVVHECGHFYDSGMSSVGRTTYVIRPSELTFVCENGDTTSRGGKTFARSLIKQDAYYAQRETCAPGASADDCDSYASLYLNGSPIDAKFDSGDQGYSHLLEEAVQYVNSLATSLAFETEDARTKVSARDGILTLLWYVERYLAMARTDYPEAYAVLSGDSCWRQVTLTVWDRAWFYLRATEGMNLGIHDAELEELVNDPDLIAEIDRIRVLECE